VTRSDLVIFWIEAVENPAEVWHTRRRAEPARLHLRPEVSPGRRGVLSSRGLSSVRPPSRGTMP